MSAPAAEAERHVIGAILRDSSILPAVKAEVVPKDFADMRLGDIYRGMVLMDAQREPIDALTVWDHLTDWDVRGIDVTDLYTWRDAVSTVKNAGYYARLIREAALVRELAKIGYRLQESQEPGLDAMKAIEDIRTLMDRDGGGSVELRMLRDVLDVPESEDAYDWVVPDLLERQDRLMLTGSEGGGKSVLLRQIGVLSAAGLHPFRFFPMPPIRTLVIDAENSERQWRRSVRSIADAAQMRGARDPRDHLGLHCSPRMDITKPNELALIHQLMDRMKPDLVVIGPLYRLVPHGVKDDETATPVLAALDSIRERGVAMLIEAHAGHATSSSGERDLRPRGSSALLGWPEFGLGLRRGKPDHTGRVPFDLVRWRGDRDRRQWPPHLVRGQVWPWEPTVQL